MEQLKRKANCVPFEDCFLAFAKLTTCGFCQRETVIKPVTTYSSASQSARVSTEGWVASSVNCPACGGRLSDSNRVRHDTFDLRNAVHMNQNDCGSDECRGASTVAEPLWVSALQPHRKAQRSDLAISHFQSWRSGRISPIT